MTLDEVNRKRRQKGKREFSRAEYDKARSEALSRHGDGSDMFNAFMLYYTIGLARGGHPATGSYSFQADPPVRAPEASPTVEPPSAPSFDFGGGSDSSFGGGSDSSFGGGGTE